MNPEQDFDGASFALLSSGANFSCEVLRALLQRKYLPRLVVLPEYPPASGAAEIEGLCIASAPQRRLMQLAHDIEIAYAPAALQADLADLLMHREIDFLLVACWPYLIRHSLRESVRKAALNLHPSLLPLYRGPNPLQQQLSSGDTRFGVTLHRLDQHFDQGDIIAQAELTNTILPLQRSSLEQRCATRGVELLIEAIRAYPDWDPAAQPA